MLMLSRNQDQPKKSDSDVQWRNLPWSLIHLCGEMQLCERWVHFPSQRPTGNKPDKDLSGTSKYRKLELEKSHQTRVECKTKRKTEKTQKCQKQLKFWTNRWYFLHTNSIWLSRLFQFSLLIYLLLFFMCFLLRLERYSIRSFWHFLLVCLSSQKCCTESRIYTCMSQLWEQHSFLAWSLPVVA